MQVLNTILEIRNACRLMSFIYLFIYFWSSDFLPIIIGVKPKHVCLLVVDQWLT